MITGAHTLVLTVYYWSLSRIGLPSHPEWLDLEHTWVTGLPVHFGVIYLGYVARDGRRARGPVPPARLVGTAAVLVALVGLGVVAASETGPGDEQTTVTSAGPAGVEQGPFFGGNLTETDGELRLVAEDRNPRVTPLPPRDRVDLTASFGHPNGTRYEVAATQPMVDDPRGRFGTWWGVGIDKWHHGRSGVGTALVPATRSQVACRST